MKTDTLRSLFLDYFVERGHKLVPSSSLVPHRDPSVLLTTAGMQQFKPYFLGMAEAPDPRLTSVQKCFRTTDIDRVGLTARHCTFFEMLGNFSVGDYFKEGAIKFGYEFSTDYMELEPDRIWVSVFEGDDEVEPDSEAVAHWKEVGVPEERIVYLPRSENFWGPPGPTGPCGPCSELYYDRGAEYGCGSPDCLPGCDCDRFFEYWNLVFMQYNQDENRTLTPLPAKNIDTGMGLERIAALKQDVDSIFLADSFRPLIELAEELSGNRFGEDEAVDVGMRVLADHARALAFLVADGVLPGNEGRGYVLRRVIRRAVRFSRNAGLEPPFLERFADRVIDMYAHAYPELEDRRSTILRIAGGEEERFNRTLDQGMALLEEEVEKAEAGGSTVFPGDAAFRLHDTYGFPVEVTREIVGERGFSLDNEAFEQEMEAQRARARASQQDGDGLAEAIQQFARENAHGTEFKGYEEDEIFTIVEKVSPLEDDRLLLSLRESPFYPEGGGQIADHGWVESETGRVHVDDVQQQGEVQVLIGRLVEGKMEAGTRAKVAISTVRRHSVAANHTGTHLLHYALRTLLGKDVTQAGSSVRPDKFRFDYAYHEPLTPEQIEELEEVVNRKIVEDHPVRAFTTNYEHARDLGAAALFGEKYGDFVRVVEIDEFSRELCGGTHVGSSSEIGAFKILSEAGVGANVRRIEAVTGKEAVEYYRSREALLADAARELGVQADQVPTALRKLKESREALEEEVRDLRAGKTQDVVGQILEGASEEEGVNVVTAQVPARDMDHLVSLLDQIRDRLAPAAVGLGAVADGTPILAVGVTKDVDRVHAGEVVKDGASVLGGGGGGSPTLGRAGGGSPKGLDEALTAIDGRLRALLRG